MAKEVTGVELVQSAINDANANAKINKIHNCEFVCADVNRWLDKNKKQKFDKIIIDPPRAGLTKDLIQILLTLLAPRSLSEVGNFQLLTYISCNPATFARDIRELEKQGLKLKKVQPLDMFPQTHHLECVGIIARY